MNRLTMLFPMVLLLSFTASCGQQGAATVASVESIQPHESDENDGSLPDVLSARFELLHNGERACISGINGDGVLNVIISYVKREGESAAYHLSVSALGQYDSTSDKHVAWATPGIQVGDEITVRVLSPGGFDDPRPLEHGL